jgi:two-component system cell cycle response regulator
VISRWCSSPPTPTPPTSSKVSGSAPTTISANPSNRPRPSRRHLDEQLASHAASAARHHYELSVAVVDIDRFKSVNDTHGHSAGDAVLQEVARRLAAAARVEDVVGRWGGEEFIVILPHCGVEGAAVVAERIREEVSATPVRWNGSVSIPVTVSVGCTGGGDDGLIERADAALYAAKKAGRNTTVVVEPPVSFAQP